MGECTDLGEDEPTAMSARARGLPATHYSIDFYDVDPMVGDVQPALTIGEFMPNSRDVISVFGMYDEDISLQGPMSIEGGYIGLTCKDSGQLVGCCEVEVMEKGDHDHNDDEAVEFDQP